MATIIDQPDRVRRRLRSFVGGVDAGCSFVVVDGKQGPRPTAEGAVSVGADWLRMQGIDRKHLEGAP